MGDYFLELGFGKGKLNDIYTFPKFVKKRTETALFIVLLYILLYEEFLESQRKNLSVYRQF